MFVDGETDDEVMLDMVAELPAELRVDAFMLALVLTGGSNEG